MRRNNLSNGTTQRIVIVFEGLLGFLPDKTAEILEQTAIRMRRWPAAVEQWELVPMTVTQIWHLYWHLDLRIDIVTFKGPKFGSALRDRLQRDDVPHEHLLADKSPYRFARQLAYMPDVAAVLDPDPSHSLIYGPKGRIVSYSDQFASVL